VLRDGTADRSAELIALQCTVRRRKIAPRIEQVITNELKCVAMQFVGPGFRHRTDGCSPAALSGKAARLDLELLKSIGKWKRKTLPIVRINMKRPVEAIPRGEAQAA